jgi:hypothetical protein
MILIDFIFDCSKGQKWEIAGKTAARDVKESELRLLSDALTG